MADAPTYKEPQFDVEVFFPDPPEPPAKKLEPGTKEAILLQACVEVWDAKKSMDSGKPGLAGLGMTKEERHENILGLFNSGHIKLDIEVWELEKLTH